MPPSSASAPRATASDAAGYRRTFNDSFRCLEQLLPQLPVLQQIIYTGSCSIYGDAGGGWVMNPPGSTAR